MKRLFYIKRPSNPLCFWIMNFDPYTREYESFWLKNGQGSAINKWRRVLGEGGKLNKREIEGIICEL